MTTILEAALKRGKTAKGYLFGAVGPDYYDCSGLIWRATQDAGVYSGDRYTTSTILQTHQFNRIITPRIDDIVVWDYSGVHGHMGVISGPDQFYSARSHDSGIGYLTISSFHVYPVKPIYLRPVKSDGYTIPRRDLFLTSPLMQGSDVKVVQRFVEVIVDGFYGPDTKAAVQRWQSAHKLEADGIVGPLTRKAMGI